MLILGIETSCDETAVALLHFESSERFLILSEEVSSQVDVHRDYGGVVPELASREHLRALPLLFERALRGAGKTVQEIDLIAVTRGPGLKGCLLTGVEFAQGLSAAVGIPMVGVNHIEGHVWAPKLTSPELQAPFLALIASGGHSEIQFVSSFGSYRLIARTVDDAAGEAFDKSAALMDFPYPGGPKLASLADTFQGKPRFSLPKVMREAKGLSFAGLKTAISLLVEREKRAGTFEENRAELAYTVQDSIVDALLYKVKKALETNPVDTLVITGGVSANEYLRERARSLAVQSVIFPARQHCMDNAAMIAYVAGCHSERRVHPESDPSVFPRWPIEQTGAQAV